jgi:sulfatase modifying factor 1
MEAAQPVIVLPNLAMKFLRPILLAASVALIAEARASVTIAWVTVGNAGNPADPTTGYGAVAYEYQIGKYEVTNAQYGAFLNAKAATDIYSLYSSYMPSYGITRSGSSGNYSYIVDSALANRPIVQVSWYDAARFSNWLHNGQGSGDTETGAYTLNGNTGIITKNNGAQIYIPTREEWYKAAYYDPNKAGTGGYWLYPNASSSINEENANYGSSASTDVGVYSNAPSAYGTYDQGGNVYEWNDTRIGVAPVLRGGSWGDPNHPSWVSSLRLSSDVIPTHENLVIGFRVASVASVPVSVPEPSSFIPAMLICIGVMMRRRR